MASISQIASTFSNSNSPVLDSLGVQFGVPQCLLDFSKDLLNALPSNALNSFRNNIKQGKSMADSVAKNLTRKLFLDSGIVEYDTNQGKFVFVSNSSYMGIQEDERGILDDVAGIGTILGFGAQAWAIGEGIYDQFTDIKDCIGGFLASLKVKGGKPNTPLVVTDPETGEEISFSPPPSAAEDAALLFDSMADDFATLDSFISACDAQIKAINEIKQARLADPENNPEPAFNGDLVNENGEKLSDLLKNTSFNVLTVADSGVEEVPDVFSIEGTTIGPPIAKQGQYLLSKTGIYYDSYSGGLDYEGCITNIVNAIYFDEEGNPIPGKGVPEKAMEFLLEHNPNLGGKGEPITWHTFNKWANTVFDLDFTDESPEIQQWYEEDQFLQVLIDNRNREVYDLSSLVTDYVDTYGDDSALTINQRQVLYSKISDHDDKVKRRKKQIQVHFYLNPEAKIGEIPINNLEKLDSGLIAVQKALQERIVFNPGEVSGIILPLCPTFVKSDPPQDTFTVDELNVPPVGIGGIINVDKNLESGTSGTLLSLTDSVSTSGLVAIYNFLDADLVNPASTKYFANNGATTSTSGMPAQLVASSIDSLFPSGIGLPYFRGICNFFSGINGDGNPKVGTYTTNDEYLHSAYRPYGYARIEGGWNDTDSLFYKNSGASIETWLHVPDLGDEDGLGWNNSSELSSLHRVVLGCENRGGEAITDDPNLTVGPINDSTSVKGCLMGFTRDRRLTQGLLPSNDPADNSINDGLAFYFAPTQSINTSAVTFLSTLKDKAFCAHDEEPTSGVYGLVIDTSTVVNSKKISDVSSSFMHLAVTFDYEANEVKAYLDGDLIKTQTVQDTFGTSLPPRLPSMVDTSSFSYENIYASSLPVLPPLFPPNSVGQKDFWYFDGPRPTGRNGSPPQTPWIIGGGYTDGMTSLTPDGTSTGMNFLGGEWGGKKSGLFGFVGSLKLYTRAVSSTEVLNNFNSQKGFFKNLKV